MQSRRYEYKYLIDGQFECVGFPNRTWGLDDVNYDAGTPMMPPVGIWDYCTDVSTDVPGDLPRPVVTIHLAQNYPNPFRARTAIQFDAVEPGNAVIQVFDVTGRKVRTLLERRVDEGAHVVHWNGVDDLGRSVSPGVYFYTLKLGGGSATKRMIYLP